MGAARQRVPPCVCVRRQPRACPHALLDTAPVRITDATQANTGSAARASALRVAAPGVFRSRNTRASRCALVIRIAQRQQFVLRSIVCSPAQYRDRCVTGETPTRIEAEFACFCSCFSATCAPLRDTRSTGCSGLSRKQADRERWSSFVQQRGCRACAQTFESIE
jgi:hypothetical protein